MKLLWAKDLPVEVDSSSAEGIEEPRGKDSSHGEGVSNTHSTLQPSTEPRQVSPFTFLEPHPPPQTARTLPALTQPPTPWFLKNKEARSSKGSQS